MVWIPRVEELPLSVMISDKKMHVAITIRKCGFGSTDYLIRRLVRLLAFVVLMGITLQLQRT